MTVDTALWLLAGLSVVGAIFIVVKFGDDE